jgi:hypothetical protein
LEACVVEVFELDTGIVGVGVALGLLECSYAGGGVALGTAICGRASDVYPAGSEAIGFTVAEILDAC